VAVADDLPPGRQATRRRRLEVALYGLIAILVVGIGLIFSDRFGVVAFAPLVVGVAVGLGLYALVRRAESPEPALHRRRQRQRAAKPLWKPQFAPGWAQVLGRLLSRLLRL
jgi:hypothetical protein